MYILIHDKETLFMFGNDTNEHVPDLLNIENHTIKKNISEDPDFQFQHFSKDKTIIEAAGGMILNQKNELLMIFRRGFWDMPKGKVDLGETLDECALREVIEETGLSNLIIIKKLQTTFHTYPIQKTIALKPSHWYLMQFHGNEIPIPQTEEDITEIRWVNKEKAAELLPQMYASIREMVLKYFL